MADKQQLKRSSTAGAVPATDAALPGEPYVNLADRRFGVRNAAGVASDVVPVTHHSDAAAYAIGDLVIQNGILYSCIVANTAQAFNFTNFETYGAAAGNGISFNYRWSTSLTTAETGRIAVSSGFPLSGAVTVFVNEVTDGGNDISPPFLEAIKPGDYIGYDELESNPEFAYFIVTGDYVKNLDVFEYPCNVVSSSATSPENNQRGQLSILAAPASRIPDGGAADDVLIKNTAGSYDYDWTNPPWAKWQGDWLAGAYELDDMVKNGDLLMIANKDTSEVPSLVAVDWDLMADAGGGGGGGDVSKVGTPVDNQVGVWTGDGTIEGVGDFIFDATTARMTLGAGTITSPEVIINGSASGTPTINFNQNGINRANIRWQHVGSQLQVNSSLGLEFRSGNAVAAKFDGSTQALNLSGYINGYPGTPADAEVLTWVTANNRAEFLPAGGGGVGGADTQFQYNNGGALGGIPSLVYNDAADTITFTPTGALVKSFSISSAVVSTEPLLYILGSGTGKSSPMVEMHQSSSSGGNTSSSTLQLSNSRNGANILELRRFGSNSSGNAIELIDNASTGATMIQIDANALTNGRMFAGTNTNVSFAGNAIAVALTGAANSGTAFRVDSNGTGTAFRQFSGTGFALQGSGGISIGGGIQLLERADHAYTPTATFGEIWLKSGVTQALMFTDDAGTDYDLTAGGGGWQDAGGFVATVAVPQTFAIPAGTTVIKVVFDDLGTSAPDQVLIRLRQGGTINLAAETSLSTLGGTGLAAQFAGVQISAGASATVQHLGAITFTHAGGNIWIAEGMFKEDGATAQRGVVSRVTMAGEVDGIQITTSAGTGNFDNGRCQVWYQ